MNIRKALSHNKNHYNGTNKKLFITIHDTGNQSKGANAEMHRRFIDNGSSETWHYTVDDREAIQHFDHSIQCWHAGDSRGNGNLHSIGIEICVNSDGNYTQAIKNTVVLVQKLMKELNIDSNHVVQHNHWSGKDCPRQIRNGRDGINWNKFKEMLKSRSSSPMNKPEKAKTGWIAQNGKFTLAQALPLTVDDSGKGKLIATLPKGSTVAYNAYRIDQNGYVWIRQKREKGYGYMATGNSKNGKRVDYWGTFK